MHSTPQLSVSQVEALHANLNPGRVAKRTQGRSQLSYLEAWDVRATLIRVFGYGGFSADVLKSDIIHAENYEAKDQADKRMWHIAAQATMRLHIPQLGVTYTETAIAGQNGPTYGDVADFAMKTAVSDALKRCAINLGSSFGLSLYRDGSTQDVVKVVVAPGQREIIADLNTARADKGEAGQAAASRLQERLKVHAVEPEPETDPVGAAQATLTAPTTTPRAARSKGNVSADRQAIARQALADAEAKAGLGERVEEHIAAGRSR